MRFATDRWHLPHIADASVGFGVERPCSVGKAKVAGPRISRTHVLGCSGILSGPSILNARICAGDEGHSPKRG